MYIGNTSGWLGKSLEDMSSRNYRRGLQLLRVKYNAMWGTVLQNCCPSPRSEKKQGCQTWQWNFMSEKELCICRGTTRYDQVMFQQADTSKTRHRVVEFYSWVINTSLATNANASMFCLTACMQVNRQCFSQTVRKHLPTSRACLDLSCTTGWSYSRPQTHLAGHTEALMTVSHTEGSPRLSLTCCLSGLGITKKLYQIKMYTTRQIKSNRN